MRRFLLAVVVLTVLAVVFVVSRHGEAPTRQVAERAAEPAPYPRSARPLPVPEMVIVEGPWKDPLPTETMQVPSNVAGSLLGSGPDGFTSCRTGRLDGPACDVLGHR